MPNIYTFKYNNIVKTQRDDTDHFFTVKFDNRSIHSNIL